jgi:hypothetical protein
MDFKTKLTPLVGSLVTIIVVGRSEEFVGTLLEIGTDYLALDIGADEGPHHSQSLFPITAVACVGHRT